MAEFFFLFLPLRSFPLTTTATFKFLQLPICERNYPFPPIIIESFLAANRYVGERGLRQSPPPNQAVQLFWNLTAIKHFWQNCFFELAWNCRSLLSDQLLDFFPPSTLPPKNTSTFRWRARNGGSSGPCHFFSSARQSVSQDFAPLTCFIVRIKPGTYFNCIMFMVASSVVTTIMILNYHHRLADTHEMPNWVRTFKISHTNG